MNSSVGRTPERLKELVTLGGLTGLFILLTVLFWGTQGDPLVDRGRELLFPQQMLRGAVLYRDLFNHQGPLAYQLNSLAIFLFSDHLTTYLTLAAMFCFSVLMVCYGIARQFFTRWVALTISAIILMASFFSINRTPTLMFPYSYSILYALSFYMSALFCLLLWIRHRQARWFFLASGLMGASAISKIDFIGFIPLLVGAGWYYGLPKKNKEIAVLVFLGVPLLSVVSLGLRGLTWTDFMAWFGDFRRYTSGYASVFYGTHGFFLTALKDVAFFKTAVVNGGLFLSGLSLFVAVHYGVLKVGLLKGQRLLGKSLWFVLVFGLAVMVYATGGFPWLGFIIRDEALTFVSPLVLISTISLGLGSWITRKKTRQTLKEQSWKEQCALWLLFGCIMGCLRVIFYLDMGVYGNYFLPPLLLALAVLGLYWLPEKSLAIAKCKLFSPSLWKVSLLSVILIMVGVRLALFYRHIQQNQAPFQTVKGTLLLNTQRANTLQNVYDYLSDNVPKSARVFMMPDGPFFNYALGYETDAYLFSWHPPHLDMKGGEAATLDRFKANSPDYVLIQNDHYTDYGVKDFSRYAPEIMRYIESAYILEQRFEAKQTNEIVPSLSVRLYRKVQIE